MFEKLKASAKDTISKVFVATDPVIAKLNLPLFTAVLAVRTEDPRNFIVEAQHMAQEGAFVEARQRLTALEDLAREPQGVKRFRTEVNKLLRELDRTAEKILSSYGVETPQGIPVSAVIKLANLALKPTGIAIPDLAGGSVIPIPGLFRGRNFGAVYRSMLSELVSVARLGKLHRYIRSRIELVQPPADEDPMIRRTSGRKVSWIEPRTEATCPPKPLSSIGQSNFKGTAVPSPAVLSRSLQQARRDWSIEDIDTMTYLEECTGIEIIFVPWTCSSCEKHITVFHAGALNPDASSMLCITSYMYWPDILREVEGAQRKYGLPRMGAVKPRRSQKGGRTAMSQGCPECDAPVEEMLLWEDFTAICDDDGIFGNPNFKFKLRPSWPPEGFEDVAEQIRAEYAEDG